MTEDEIQSLYVDQHEYEIFVSKREANNSVVSRSLGHKINSRAHIIVRDTSGTIAKEKLISSSTGSFFDHRKDDDKNRFSMKRAEVMTVLEENAFIIELKIERDYIDRKTFHFPCSPMAKNALKMLTSGEDADCSFLVGDTVIYAHKLILKLNTELLHTFVVGTDDNSPVKIEGTSPEIFRFVLEYIYGDDNPDFNFLLEHYEDVIEVSNKYGVIGLKLQAEAAKISSLTIDDSNVTEHLIFAHSKNCVLLKEYATSIYISKFDDLVRSSSLEELAKSPDVLRELMIAVADSMKKSVPTGYSRTLPRIIRKITIPRSDSTVNDLIGELIDLDLDIDGTKETLISRLDEYHKAKLCSSEAEE